MPQLANLNRDAAGVDISLRRAGNLVILEGRVDLTNVNDPDADVELTVSFPGEVTSTNGDRIDTDVVEWKLKPGVVSTMSAQARVHRPEYALVHRRRTVAGARRAGGRRCDRGAGLDQPRPFAAVRRRRQSDELTLRRLYSGFAPTGPSD